MPLVSWYPLQETGTSTAYDVRGGNNGTLNGGVTQGATGLLGTSAYEFDGTDDYVQTSLSEFPETFTISLWFLTRNGGSVNENVVTNFNSTGEDVRFGVQNNNEYLFTIDKGANLSPSSPAVSADEWTHLVGVGNNSSGLKLYLNGEEIGSVGASWTGTHNSGRNIDFGDNALNGLLADVRIYDHALSPAEIQYLYDVVAGKSSLMTDSKVV